MNIEPQPPRRSPGAKALWRLGMPKRFKHIPHVAQVTAADCGSACLAMILAYHGRDVSLGETRRAAGTNQNGTNALELLRAGRTFGLRGRGVQVDVDDLELLPKGTILHWEFNHFVVLESSNAKGVVIVDPALGQRRLSLKRFGEAFTGVALIFEPGEDFEPESRKRPLLGRYFGEVLKQRVLWSRALLMSLLLQVLALGLPVMTTMLVERVIPRQDLELLGVLAGGLTLMVGFNFLSSLVRANLLVQMRTLLDAKFTVDFVEHLVALPFSFFQERSAGDLMMRLGSNATVREILTSGAMSALLDGVLVSLYLVLIFSISWVVALVVLALTAVQMLLYFATRTRQRELMNESLAAQAKTSGYEVEMLTGIEALKSMGAEDRAVERWSNLFVESLNISVRRGRLDALISALMGAFSMAAPLIILATGGWLVLGGQLSLGAMLGLSALAGGFLGPMQALVNTTLQFQLLGSYLDRIEDVLKATCEQADESPVPAARLRGAIDTESVGFSYSEETGVAVDNVSIHIEPGQFVAIVGASGAGKSTLAKLLVGLYQPSSGRVLYDNVDLRSLELRSVRRQLGVVTQQGSLFGMSVRENISLGQPDVDLDAVERAAKLARIHDDIVRLPMGYDTMLADRGASLSGGQQQRIALARALVGHPAILLLDEATSALDSVSERAIQEALAGLQCTRVAIAHRMSTVVGADLILVMDQGRVVESGTHHELMTNSDVYRRLFARRSS